MAHLLGDPEFWVLLAVVIFVIAVWKPAKRAIIGALDSRAERIRQELEAASNLREEAQQALAAYQRRQQEGAAEAQAIITHAKEEAERIAQEEAKALAEIRSIAVDVAISAARQVIAASLDERRGAALIDDAIAALPRQLH